MLEDTVPTARLRSRAVLAEWGLSHVERDVSSVLTELLTNAIEATRRHEPRALPPVTVRLLADRRRLVTEVWDRVQAPPQIRETGPFTERGRGLVLVAALSQDWGSWRAGDCHKVVFAMFAL